MIASWITALGALVLTSEADIPYSDWENDAAALSALLAESPDISAQTRAYAVVESEADKRNAQRRRQAAKRRLAPGELTSFVGRRVEVLAHNSRRIIGRLDEVRPDGITMTVGRPGNQATFFVENERIDYARVRLNP